MRTPYQAIGEMLQMWEGGYSNDPADTGNYWQGQLVGSKWGVTPQAYADFTGAAPTVERIKNLTAEFAGKLAYERYFHRPGWHKLPWGPVVESLFDFSYNCGPKNVVMKMQALTGVAEDGTIGPLTTKAFIEWINDSGVKDALLQVLGTRIGYYERVVALRPSNKKYLKGWIRRASYYTMESTEWSNKWQTSV